MITFLGAIIFMTVIAIGAADWHSGLGLFQKYTPVWRDAGGPRVASGSPRRRQRRDLES
jgi:hypothetical protein